MAIKSFYVESEGIYIAGLSPTFSMLKKESNSSDFSQPSISEIGTGWYKFTASPPTDDRIVGVVNCGGSVGIANRYRDVMLEYYDNERIYDQINVANDHKEVYVMPVYDSDADSLTFFAYLMENGQIVSTSLTSITITVYDDTHTQAFSETETSNTNGVFIVTKSTPNLTNGEGYYATAVITKDDTTTISSVETYVALD